MDLVPNVLEDGNFEGICFDGLGEVVIECISCEAELKLEYFIIGLIEDEFPEDVDESHNCIGCISDLFIEVVPNDHAGKDVLLLGLDVVEILLEESQRDSVDGVLEVTPIIIVHQDCLISLRTIV